MKRNGASQKEIAGAIGKHPSTVSREFRRAGMTSGTYCFVAAQEHADSREWKGQRIDPEIWSLVEPGADQRLACQALVGTSEP